MTQATNPTESAYRDELRRILIQGASAQKDAELMNWKATWSPRIQSFSKEGAHLATVIHEVFDCPNYPMARVQFWPDLFAKLSQPVIDYLDGKVASVEDLRKILESERAVWMATGVAEPSAFEEWLHSQMKERVRAPASQAAFEQFHADFRRDRSRLLEVPRSFSRAIRDAELSGIALGLLLPPQSYRVDVKHWDDLFQEGVEFVLHAIEQKRAPLRPHPDYVTLQKRRTARAEQWKQDPELWAEIRKQANQFEQGGW